MSKTTVMQAKRLGVLTCTPDTKLVDAAERMTGEDVSALVVVNEEGYLVGILSRIDLLRAWDKSPAWAGQAVAEYMSAQVVTVGLNSSLAEVCDLLLNERIHRVVAVRHEGDKMRPVAVISAADVIYHMVKLAAKTRGAGGA